MNKYLKISGIILAALIFFIPLTSQLITNAEYSSKLENSTHHNINLTFDQLINLYEDANTDQKKQKLINLQSTIEQEYEMDKSIIQWIQEKLETKRLLEIIVQDQSVAYIALNSDETEISTIMLGIDDKNHTFYLDIEKDQAENLVHESYILNQPKASTDSIASGVAEGISSEEQSQAIEEKQHDKEQSEIILSETRSLKIPQETVEIFTPDNSVSTVSFNFKNESYGADTKSENTYQISSGTLTFYDNQSAVHSGGKTFAVNSNTVFIVSGIGALNIQMNNTTNPITINSITSTNTPLIFNGQGVLNLNSSGERGISGRYLVFNSKGKVDVTGSQYGIYSNEYILLTQGFTLTAQGGKIGARSAEYLELRQQSKLEAKGLTENGIEVGSYLSVLVNSSVSGIGEKIGINVSSYIADSQNVGDQVAPKSYIYGKGLNRGIKTAQGYIIAHADSEFIGEAYGENSIGIESAYSGSADYYIKSFGGTIKGTGVQSGVVMRSLGYIFSTNLLGRPGILIGTATGQDGIGIQTTNSNFDPYIHATGQGSMVIGDGDKHGIYSGNGTVRSHLGATVQATSRQLQQENAAIYSTRVTKFPQSMGSYTGGIIHEIYENAGVVYTPNPTIFTSQLPYKSAIGRNMKDMSKYTWTDSVDNFQTGTVPGIVKYNNSLKGLVADGAQDDIAVRGTRKNYVDSEQVYVEYNSTYMVTLMGNSANPKLDITMWDKYLSTNPENVDDPSIKYQIFDKDIPFTISSSKQGFNTVETKTDENGKISLLGLEVGSYTISGGIVDGYKQIDPINFSINNQYNIEIHSGDANYYKSQDGDIKRIEVYYYPELIEYNIKLLDRYDYNQGTEKRIGGTVKLVADVWSGPHETVANNLKVNYSVNINNENDKLLYLHPRYTNWSMEQSNNQTPKYYTIYDQEPSYFDISRTSSSYDLSNINLTPNVHIITGKKEIIITNDYELIDIKISLRSSRIDEFSFLESEYRYYPLENPDRISIVKTSGDGYASFTVHPEQQYVLEQVSSPNGHIANKEQYIFSLDYIDKPELNPNSFGFNISGHDENEDKSGWNKSFTDEPKQSFDNQNHFIDLVSLVGSLKVEIDATDVWHFHGEPSFIVKLTSSSEPTISYYKIATVQMGETDFIKFNNNLGENIGSTYVEFENLPVGDYTVSVMSTLRYSSQDKTTFVEVTDTEKAEKHFLFQNKTLLNFSDTGVLSYKFKLG